MRGLIRLATFVVAAAAISHPGFTQQHAKVHRIGFLGPTSAPPSATSQLDILRKALADLGYVEGGNITIVGRWPDGERLDQLPGVAAALVADNPDVIVAAGATAVRAAKGATSTIPIVFAGVVDPVATGLVSNLARPGGNLTGATTFDAQQARKQLEILKVAIPNVTRVALLGDSGAAPDLFHTNEEAARLLGLQTHVLKVERTANPDFEVAFESAKKEGADAVVVISTPVTTPNRRRIAELGIRYKLPTLSPREHADAGSLISFGTGFSQATRRAATFVDKILKGVEPGQLPIETVSQHELVINLKTAREIGLTFPSELLSSANHVIE